MDIKQWKSAYYCSIGLIFLMLYGLSMQLLDLLGIWSHEQISQSIFSHLAHGFLLLALSIIIFSIFYAAPKDFKMPLGVLFMSMFVVNLVIWIFNQSFEWKVSARVVGLTGGLYTFWDLRKNRPIRHT